MTADRLATALITLLVMLGVVIAAKRGAPGSAATGAGDQPGLAVEALRVWVPVALAAQQANAAEPREEARVENQAAERS